MTTTTNTTAGERRFLFLLASARRDGNAERLARRAAQALPPQADQRWLRLSDLPLPAFDDHRHEGSGIYAYPEGHGRTLLEATLEATDIVFVAPVYWYSVPAAAKLYLDHWSGWMRAPGVDFKARMAGKTMWAVSILSDDDERFADPLLGTLGLTAQYLSMRWGGSLLRFGNRPGDVFDDPAASTGANLFFASIDQPVAATA